MIHKYNIAELSLVDRPVRGPDAGFGTVVNKHEKGHDAVHRKTSQAEAFGYGRKLNPDQQVDSFKNSLAYGGGLSLPRPFVEQGVKCISGLTGEVYKLDDPQESTDVQRSWLYSKDPSVAAMQKGKTDQTLLKDNALSLPLGDGERAAF